MCYSSNVRSYIYDYTQSEPVEDELGGGGSMELKYGLSSWTCSLLFHSVAPILMTNDALRCISENGVSLFDVT